MFLIFVHRGNQRELSSRWFHQHLENLGLWPLCSMIDNLAFYLSTDTDILANYFDYFILLTCNEHFRIKASRPIMIIKISP